MLEELLTGKERHTACLTYRELAEFFGMKSFNITAEF